jgi:hypothetical protein
VNLTNPAGLRLNIGLPEHLARRRRCALSAGNDEAA